MAQQSQGSVKEPMPEAGQERVYGQAIGRFNAAAERQFASGMAKYGTALQTFNGRSAYNDAMQEAVDLVQYLTQLEMERREFVEILGRLIFDGGDPNEVPEHIVKLVAKETK